MTVGLCASENCAVERERRHLRLPATPPSKQLSNGHKEKTTITLYLPTAVSIYVSRKKKNLIRRFKSRRHLEDRVYLTVPSNYAVFFA